MRLPRFLSSVTTTALAVGGFTAVILVAAPPAMAQETVVPGNTASSWQTNDAVYGLAAANGNVYLGGQFTSVRPPGAALGTGEVARARLAAFSASSGALVTSFNHTVNGTIFAVTASPDGKTVYIGGDFSTVDGVA